MSVSTSTTWRMNRDMRRVLMLRRPYLGGADCTVEIFRAWTEQGIRKKIQRAIEKWRAAVREESR